MDTTRIPTNERNHKERFQTKINMHQEHREHNGKTEPDTPLEVQGTKERLLHIQARVRYLPTKNEAPLDTSYKLC